MYPAVKNLKVTDLLRGTTMPNKKLVISEINLPKISDTRGDLTFVEGGNHIPFSIKRVYYLYNVPVGAERGGHAHRALEQVVFAISGSFRLLLDSGRGRSEILLRDPARGVYLKNLTWREIDSFSQGAVCMVLASEAYDEADYIRNYDEFKKLALQEGPR